jgi:hypothetical protein
MEKTLDAWTGDVAEYLRATQDLYAYLEEHPDRARPCFGALFEERLSEKDAKSLSPLNPNEKRKLDRLDGALRKVLDVLAVPEEAAYSPDEVSHLVYDPFPARLSLKLPSAPLSMEGFLTAEDASLSVPSPSLWEALRSLEGRWLAPDPVLFYVESAQREGEGSLDLDAFLARPRHSEPAHLLPSADEVRAQVVSHLKPAPLYRVSWKIRPDDDAPFRWEEGEGR